MKKILCINAPRTEMDAPFFPDLDLIKVARTLKMQKFFVSLIDLDLEKEKIDSIDDSIEIMKPEYVIISADTNSIQEAFQLAELVKHKNKAEQKILMYLITLEETLSNCLNIKDLKSESISL